MLLRIALNILYLYYYSGFFFTTVLLPHVWHYAFCLKTELKSNEAKVFSKGYDPTWLIGLDIVCFCKVGCKTKNIPYQQTTSTLIDQNPSFFSKLFFQCF